MITSSKANPPHNGIVTHNHDQSMVPVSFRIINIRANAPVKDIPTLLFDSFDIIFLFVHLINVFLA